MCRIDEACTPYRERVRRCVFVSSVANWRCTGRGAADDDEDACRAAAPYVDALRGVRADETRRRREAYIAVAGFEDVGYSVVLDAVDPDVQRHPAQRRCSRDERKATEAKTARPQEEG